MMTSYIQYVESYSICGRINLTFNTKSKIMTSRMFSRVTDENIHQGHIHPIPNDVM